MRPVPANNYIAVIERTLRVLESFEGQQNVRLADLAARTGLVKSSVFRILFTLERLGYVERGPERRYSLSTRFSRLAGPAGAGADLASSAAPFMTAILHRFQETVNLGVLEKEEVLYVRVMESPHVLRLAAHAGMRSPVYSTALGKCLLAHWPKAEVESILRRGPLKALTPRTLRDRVRFFEELRRVREQGYAVDDQEDSHGIRCIGAPIFGADGSVVAALSISAPAVRLPPRRDREVAAALKEVCARISGLRGHPGAEVATFGERRTEGGNTH